jgi:hypothetical protein
MTLVPVWRYVIVLLPLIALAGAPEIEIRDSEVWLIRDGQAKQLTHDGKSKLQAVLSQALDRVAYYEQCPQAERCTPSIVILDLEGRRVASFQPKHQAIPPAVPCASVLFIAWVQPNAIAAECHINPSLSEYIETDFSTGKTTRDLLGYDFTPSPDSKKIAHVGWIVHFAPPYAQSNYLQVENRTIYPLPKGTQPIEQKLSEGPPGVVSQRGLTYSGIHEFAPGLAWSPDAERIALIDCTYDWTANQAGSLSAGDGKESNRQCSLAAVSIHGKFVLQALPDLAPRDLFQARLAWVNPHRISLTTNKGTKYAMQVP